MEVEGLVEVVEGLEEVENNFDWPWSPNLVSEAQRGHVRLSKQCHQITLSLGPA